MEPPRLREDLAHTGEARMGGNSEATAELPSTAVDWSRYWKRCDLGSGSCAMAHRSFPDPSYMGMWLTTSAVHPHTMNNAAGGCQNPNCYKLFQGLGAVTERGKRTTNQALRFASDTDWPTSRALPNDAYVVHGSPAKPRPWSIRVRPAWRFGNLRVLRSQLAVQGRNR